MKRKTKFEAPDPLNNLKFHIRTKNKQGLVFLNQRKKEGKMRHFFCRRPSRNRGQDRNRNRNLRRPFIQKQAASLKRFLSVRRKSGLKQAAFYLLKETVLLNKIRLIPLFAAALLFSSCTQKSAPPGADGAISDFKRGPVHDFLQGQGDSLHPVKDLAPFRNLEEAVAARRSLPEIKTASKGKKAKIAFQDNIQIDPAVSFINEYWFLDYKPTEESLARSQRNRLWARLLGKLAKFKGFPDTNYYIAPILLKNYLVFYRIGDKESFPYDEIPLAQSFGPLAAAPLAGYPVKYCRAVPHRNIHEELTGKYRAQCEGVDPKAAQYILLAEGKQQRFRYLPKPHLFPKNYFDGQWFYNRTVVRSPGRQDTGHNPPKAARLVEFHAEEGRFAVKDAAGWNLREDDKIRALFIPLEHQGYRIAAESESSLSAGFTEELEEIHSLNLPWLKLKLNDLVQNEELPGRKSLKNLTVARDYFSFDVELTAQGEGAFRIKYGFLKDTNEGPPYTEKRWFEEDSALFFPVTAVERRYFRRALDHVQKDIERFIRVARYNPRLKEIRYYFSKQTPPANTPEGRRLREIGRLAVSIVNRAFQEAGRGENHKIRIVLDESEDKDLGDLRHNILNLIVSEGPSGSLVGFGPNVAHPVTGEVVSSTANVWVSKILESHILAVRQWIRFHVFPLSWKFHPESLGPGRFFHEKTLKLCPDVAKFIERNKGKRFQPKENGPPLNDGALIAACAPKLARADILSVLIHEMLHGAGLRHVFSASADKDHFYKTYEEMKAVYGDLVIEDGKTPSHPHPPQYSSAMDYGGGVASPAMIVPGKLDTAALRFVYYDKAERVKKQNGVLAHAGFLKIPSANRLPSSPARADQSDESAAAASLRLPAETENFQQQSILSAARSAGLSREDLRPYKVCGGKNLKKPDPDINREDFLCRPDDYGASRTEVVKNMLTDFASALDSQRRRYDSEEPPPSLAPLALKLKDSLSFFLAQWREKYKLPLLKSLEKDPASYSFLNPADLAELKAQLEAAAAKDPDFKDFYAARGLVFDFLLKTAFVPVKRCVYQAADGGWTSAALEDIEEKILSSGEEFRDCRSAAAQQHVEAVHKGGLIAEVGFFSQDRKYFVRPEGEERPDERGFFDEADSLWEALLVPLLLDALHHSPILMSRYYARLRDEFLKGSDLNPYLKGARAQGVLPVNDKGDFALPLFLTRKRDSQTAGFKAPTGALSLSQARAALFYQAIGVLADGAPSPLKSQLNRHFGFERLSHSEALDSARAEAASPGYSATVGRAFFSEAYESFRRKPAFASAAGAEERFVRFADFIRKHPETVSQAKDETYLMVPRQSGSKTAEIFRKMNETAACLEKEEASRGACPDAEEKSYWLRDVEKIIDNILLFVR